VRGYGRNLPCLVGLNAADRHQRVAPRGQRFRNQVFELACLVATKSQPAIAVLALRIQLDIPAQMSAEPA